MVIQFAILSGNRAGTQVEARRFPFVVGRGPRADLRLEEQGIWEAHFQVEVDSAEGFLLKKTSDALVVVNGELVSAIRLAHGDLIEIGTVRMRFWLAAVQQRGLRWRERLTWAALVALGLFEIYLIYLLPG